MHPIFADTPQSQEWFTALESVSSVEREKIQIPDEETWRTWLEYVEIPAEDIDAVIATTPRPETDPELYEILQNGAAQLLSKMGQAERPVGFAALNDFNDPTSRYFYVQLLTACLPYSRSHLASRNIPEEIIQATMADLGRNVRVHRKREGVGGLGVMWWLMLHFRGMIFQLGRLQFEMYHTTEDVAASIRDHGGSADESTPALSIHIPDFMGSMDPAACDDAIARAAEFFPTYFPEWPVEYGVCNSWLLDPQLKKILKPTSNIIQFQDRYELVRDGYDASDSVMQFVFGKHVRDVDVITPTSSLERGVLEHLRGGGTWQGREGWFRLPDRAANHQAVTD